MALACLGCTAAAPPPPMITKTSPRPALLGMGWFNPNPMPDDRVAPEINDPRAGSMLAQQAGAPGTTAIEPRALNDVMVQLHSIGTVDPGVQARLIDDMQKTDPSLWPHLMQTYRSSLAYQGRGPASLQQPGAAASVGTMPGTLPPEVRDGRAVSVASSMQAAPLTPQQSPWSALALPAAASAGQVALKEAAPQQVTSPSAAPPAPATAIATAADPSKPASPPQTPQPAASLAEPPQLVVAAATPIPPPSTAQSAAATKPDEKSSPAVQPVVYTAATDPTTSAALTAAIAALEQQAQTPTKDATDVSRQASLRMLYLAAGRRDDALKPIAGASPAEQEYWSKQLAGMATLLDVQTTPDASQRVAAAHQRLTETANRIGQLSPLVVKNIAFCTDVASYGVVTKFAEKEFAPGQPVLLYAEVENFKSDESPKGFHTALKSSYQVLDKQGAKMASVDPQTMEEYCQNPRRDYFVRYRLNLPKPLPDGAYTLQLTIEDTLGQKTGKASLDFTVKEKK
ncbi:MAG TPA: hypothetical protein VGG64_26520 [Pirellulales bacterium]